MAQEIQSVDLEGSVDMHFHFRDNEQDGDGRMELLAKHVANQHEIIIAIGNTTKPILTAAQATSYLENAVQHAVTCAHAPRILIAPLGTDKTTPDMIREMRMEQSERTIGFLKVFLAGVSNDFGNSVSNVRAFAPTMHALHDNLINAPPLTCHWHMERKYDEFGERVHMLDREWYAIDHDMRLVLELDPEGEHVIKHATDIRTIEQCRIWRKMGYKVWVELASHYFVRNFEDLFEGPGRKGTAFNAHDLCWPLFKHSDSTAAIIDLATWKDPDDPLAAYTLFGSDCAWWFDDPTKEGGVKIICDGIVCGGTAIMPAVSKSIVIETFVNRGRADLLNEFFSRRARALLNLPPAQTRRTYRKKGWVVPEELSRFHSQNGAKQLVRPFMRRETCNWSIDS